MFGWIINCIARIGEKRYNTQQNAEVREYIRADEVLTYGIGPREEVVELETIEEIEARKK